MDWAATLALIQQINPVWFLLALVCFAGSKALASFRLLDFLHASGASISPWSNLRLYLLGMFYNLFLPGGIGGDGYKVVLLGNHTPAKTKTLVWASLLDRASGLVWLVTLTAWMSAFIELPYGLSGWLWLAAPLPLLAWVLVLKLAFKRFFSLWWRSSLWSLGVQIGQVVVSFCILLALGVESQLVEYAFLLMLSGIVLVVPLPSFGGLGLRETLVLFGAEYLLVQEQVSVAMSLSIYLVILLLSLSGIYLHFTQENLIHQIQKECPPASEEI